MSEFHGRGEELQTLASAWKRARDGDPQVVSIEGDSGLGKTRLVQEFYISLAASALNVSAYWPRALPDYERAMSLTPAFESPVLKDRAVMPYFWLAVRCMRPDLRNVDLRGRSAFESARAQIRTHLAGFYAAKERRAANADVARSTLAILANFALPGLGSVFALGAEILGAVDSGMTIGEALRSLTRRWRQRGASSVDALAIATEHYAQSLVGATLTALTSILGGRAGSEGIPTILVVDDAHWADPPALSIVGQAFERATEEHWPLLIITTAWEQTMKEDRFAGQRYGRRYAHVLDELSEGYPNAVLRFGLGALASPEIRRIVSERFPLLDRDVADVLLAKSSGDLDLLKTYLDVLEGGGWVEEGRFAGDLAELHNLPSVKRELARERLNQLEGSSRRLLAWASAQGPRFFELFLLRARQATSMSDEVEEILTRCDTPHHVIRLAAHDLLSRVGEFRQYVYYELSQDMLKRLRERPAVLLALAEALRDTLVEPIWSQLEPRDQADVADDLVFVIESLNLQENADWLRVSVDCRLRLANASLLLGHLGASQRLAEECLEMIEDRAEDVQDLLGRAYRVLVRTAQIAGNTERETARLMERWDAAYARLYATLLDQESRHSSGGDLLTLAEEFTATGYRYLGSLACGYDAYVWGQLGRQPDTRRLEAYELTLKGSWVPAAQAYVAAAQLQFGRDRHLVTDDLARALGGCQGLKGRPKFVQQAARDLIAAGASNDESLSTLHSWMGEGSKRS